MSGGSVGKERERMGRVSVARRLRRISFFEFLQDGVVWSERNEMMLGLRRTWRVRGYKDFTYSDGLEDSGTRVRTITKPRHMDGLTGTRLYCVYRNTLISLTWL